MKNGQKNSDRRTDGNSFLESGNANAPSETTRVKKPVVRSGTRRYRLTITARRKRVLDQSNLCIKFAEDALKGIIIEDDSPKYLEAVEARQEKVERGRPAETIIEVEIIDYE